MNSETSEASALVRITTGFYEGLEWPLVSGAEVTIGRGREADLALSEPTISRVHARVGFDGGGAFVEDLGSTNGTLVNGVPQKKADLADGDMIQMGKLVLRIQLSG